MTLLLVSATVRNRLRTAIVAEKLPCLWGKPQECVFLQVSEHVLMSFCLAGMALCDIRRVSGGMCMHGRRGTKVALSMGEATRTCLSRGVRRCYTPHSTPLTPDFAHLTPHFTLYTPHSPLYTLHSHFTLSLSTLHTPHSPLYTLHSHVTLHTPRFTLHIPHFTTLHVYI